MDREFTSYPFEAQRHAAQLPLLAEASSPAGGRAAAGADGAIAQPGHVGKVDAQRRPVVVVGGGPVGYCTALGLANHGVPVVLLEADDGVCFGSRAICISRRSLEITQRLGALPGFLKIGLPWTGGRSYYRDAEVLHFTMPADQNQKLPPMLNLAQYSIEQILLDRAKERPELIDIRWQTRLATIDARDDGVRLGVSTPAGDYLIDADWVVAADGGRSFVRDALGLKLAGTSYEGRYVIVDILLDSARPPERLAYFDPPCNPGSTVLVHKQPNNVWRIDYQLRDGEDPDQAIRPENVLPRVESLLAMMGETGDWQPIWTGIYKANALTLPSYRQGRVLLAGDAAHLVPIFGVRGANSGIDDADNLAWKLAYVVKGAATEALLDSYSAERVAATHENLSYGTKSTEFMAPPSFAFELMRTAVLGLAVKHPQLASLINPRQSSAITYTHSPLNAVDGMAGAAGPVPGAVLPECPLTLVDGGGSRPAHVTDLLSLPAVPGFSVLVFADTPTLPPAVNELACALAARGLPFQALAIVPQPAAGSALPHAWDHTGRLAALFGAQEGAVYLVRPDGHVLGRWHAPRAAELSGAVQHALGLQ